MPESDDTSKESGAPNKEAAGNKPKIKFFGTGDTFPYLMELPSSSGQNFKAIDHFGKPFLFFYFIKPGDEKCDKLLNFFKKSFDQCKEMGVSVYGVCSEKEEIAKQIVDHYELPFPVLSDPMLIACRDLGLATWETINGEDEVRPGRAIVVVDGTLMVRNVLHADEAVEATVRLFVDLLSGFPSFGQAPILRIPMVFEPMLCKNLIEWWRREKDKKEGVVAVDPQIQQILQIAMDSHIGNRIIPRLRAAFRYQPQYREPPHIWHHNDLPINELIKTNQEASYREFALMIALHVEPVEGGELEFVEYSPAKYALQTGEAIVFSTQLLQRFLPLLKGDRYWYATFFYSEPQANLQDPTPGSDLSDKLF